MKYGLVLG